jgi:hypothetical protein
MHTISLSPLGGATANSLSGFSVQTQQQSQWCWAAVSVGVAVYYGPTTWTQCSVASGQFAPLDCCGADGSGGCNQPWYLDRALMQVGHFGHLIFSLVPFPAIKMEINADRPLCCRVQWVGGVGAHFVAVGGWSQDDNGTEFVEVHDPFYGFVQIGYNDFCSSYRSPGDAWTHTYFSVRTPSVAAAGGAPFIQNAPISA